MAKYIYFFGDGKAEGSKDLRNLLGGKGAGLHEMTNLGIPVPPGFTITTEACTYYYTYNYTYAPGMLDEVDKNMEKIGKILGRKYGNIENPLLVSIRSGARVSMPGMMDTVLNLGLNFETVKGLAKQANNERFAYDCFRRFIGMYSNVVMGMDGKILEKLLHNKKEKLNLKYDYELSVNNLKELIGEYLKAVREHTGKNFPEDPKEQLSSGISAVFKSWNTPRAVTYRKINSIPENWGTGVNVQAMVFGNMGENSATGVAFTRNPSTGEKIFFGEYLKNAQGEDVVAGIRTPNPINKGQGEKITLEEIMPDCYKDLEKIYKKLENHYRDMLDIEFTIENGKLWMLQTRSGKRTARAAVKIAVDMINERLISEKEAILRVDPYQLDQLLHPTLDPNAKYTIITKGLPASPGAVSGEVIFFADDAEAAKELGKKVILVREETSPEDIHGMNAALGILTSRGGMTSHAAVVARGMGKCCIVGAQDIHINYENQEMKIGEITIKKGDIITLDGGKGIVIKGDVPRVDALISPEFKTFMNLVDKYRKLKIRTNADTPHDSKVALDFGAEGIGLCRTEHMFFEEDRIKSVREMILADSEEGRKKALNKILPLQRNDFIGIFRIMDGLPVTIRLLDPPLHEFLPREEELIKDLAIQMDVSVEKLKMKIASLSEFNPMLGFRGVRLGVVYPEISEMQVKAIIEAAIVVTKEGKKTIPEIEIPVVGIENEAINLKELAKKTADSILRDAKIKIDYKIGTMIELPRACICADKLAQHLDFFSFGTNDLTQTTFGFSRDDAGKFIQIYLDKKIIEHDPFQVIDREGVGSLMKLCVEKARNVKKDLDIGICGEHGGDPSSVEFCHQIGLNYVSCSPYRVPIARLAAAQANLKQEILVEKDV
jgi:pyruvate,orthophosphate dikinase